MSDQQSNQSSAAVYTDTLTAKLETLWGEGYLSPGGDAEVDAVVADLPLFGKTVLDVGCGLGGPSLRLVEAHGAARVTAYDVEAPVLARAEALIARRDASQRIAVALGAPGPLPFADASFDLVFSKDALVHVPDKAAFYAEAWRVLKPGGWFAASDWFGELGDPTPEMLAYLDDGDLEFRLWTLRDAAEALAAAGFEQVAERDRNAWYAGVVAREVEIVEGAERQSFIDLLGEEAAEAWFARTRLRAVVAEQGQLRPGHLRGRKPR